MNTQISRPISRRGAIAGVGGLLAAGAVAQIATSSSAGAAGPPRPLGIGSSGYHVEQFQLAMNANGFWCGTVDGQFGELTQQAVYAVQKTHRRARTGKIDLALWDSGLARVRATSRYKLDGIEIDLARQLLMVVRGGIVQVALNTSTGDGSTFRFNGGWARAITPTGTFTIYRKSVQETSTNPWVTAELGTMYKPRYFDSRGFAVHGSTSIPPYPASHGCARVSTRAQNYLLSSGFLNMGVKVRIY